MGRKGHGELRVVPSEYAPRQSRGRKLYYHQNDGIDTVSAKHARMHKLIVAALTATLLAGCGAPASSLPAAVGVARDAHPANGPFPPVCTVPKVKSGSTVTSVAAYGNVADRKFSLAQPSSWTEVQWLSTLPPSRRGAAAPTALPRSAQPYYIYVGTYRVSDGTTGCFYLVTSVSGEPIDGKSNSAVTAQPRIPPKGATLPNDFGAVKNLQLKLKKDDTGTGTMTLVHYDGTAALTGTINVVGRINSTKG